MAHFFLERDGKFEALRLVRLWAEKKTERSDQREPCTPREARMMARRAPREEDLSTAGLRQLRRPARFTNPVESSLKSCALWGRSSGSFADML